MPVVRLSNKLTPEILRFWPDSLLIRMDTSLSNVLTGGGDQTLSKIHFGSIVMGLIQLIRYTNEWVPCILLRV